MSDDIQTERFGESAANESRNRNVLEALPVGNESPYAPVGEQPGSVGKSEKKGCGCWVWGCAGLMVGSLLLMGALSFVAFNFLNGQVEKYTDTEPDQIPAVEMEEEELERLQARIDSFTQRVAPSDPDADPDAEPEDGEVPEALDESPADEAEVPLELVLTANEINALIHSNEDLRGMMHVVIEDGHIQGKVSIPMDELPGGKGRYFNADAEIEVSMEGGILIVQLVDATVKGESLPEALLGPMKEQNFAKDAYDDVQTAEILRQFDSIEVVDDAIHLRLKKPEPEPEAGEGATGAEASEQSDAAPVPVEEPMELEPVLPFD